MKTRLQKRKAEELEEARKKSATEVENETGSTTSEDHSDESRLSSSSEDHSDELRLSSSSDDLDLGIFSPSITQAQAKPAPQAATPFTMFARNVHYNDNATTPLFSDIGSPRENNNITPITAAILMGHFDDLPGCGGEI